MNPFNFHLPVKIIFGTGKINTLKKEISRDIKDILIITDPVSGKQSGALKKILDQLPNKRVKIYNKINENPTFEELETGRSVIRSGNYQMIIAVGGGSPMDAAKGIAVLATNDGNMKEYMQGKELENDPLPIICIPTTSGTGSEVTPYAVFSDHEENFKGGFAHPGIYPKVSIIDPELTYSMPKNLVINTGLDAMIHSIESYLSKDCNSFTDALALHSIQTVIENLEKASQKDKEAMSKLSYASMVAGVVIAHAGTILLHIMAYPLTIYHRIPHGRANAILLPQFIEFMFEHSTVKGKVKTINELFASDGGVRQFVENLRIDTKLSSYGIEEPELKLFAEKTIVKGDVKITPAKITVETIEKIYKDTF